MNQRSKVIAGSTAAAALLVTVVALIAAKDFLLAKWWIYRLEAGEVHAQMRAAKRLGKLGSADAVPQLLALLGDLSTKDEVIVKPGEEDDPDKVSVWFSGRLLDSEKADDNDRADLWWACQQSLYKIAMASPRFAESKVLEALGHGSAVVRATACSVLLEMPTPSRRTARALEPLLQDIDPAVRHVAAAALKRAEVDAAADSAGAAPGGS